MAQDVSRAIVAYMTRVFLFPAQRMELMSNDRKCRVQVFYKYPDYMCGISLILW